MPLINGYRVDDKTAAIINEVKSRLAPLPITVTQGSYSTGVSASGGTHAGGGAADLALAGLSDNDALRIEATLRECGTAAWYRPAIAGLWPRHVHFIVKGTPDLAPAARSQLVDYEQGRNGLANKGRDTGNRSFVGATWESYSETAGPSVEEMVQAIWEYQVTR